MKKMKLSLIQSALVDHLTYLNSLSKSKIKPIILALETEDEQYRFAKFLCEKEIEITYEDMLQEIIKMKNANNRSI